MNEVKMNTVIDLGSSKVKITTFDQKKKNNFSFIRKNR